MKLFGEKKVFTLAKVAGVIRKSEIWKKVGEDGVQHEMLKVFDGEESRCMQECPR